MVSSVRFRVSPLLLLPAHGDFHLAPVARVSHLILYAAPPRIRRTDDYPAGWPLEMLSIFTFEELADGKTRLTISWSPHNATEVEQKTFDAGHDSMRQCWGGTLEQLTAYLAKARQE